MISKENSVPSINGLVLAGGKSKRMGTDKGKMLWHGKEQRYYMTDMLEPFCEDVLISCRADQEEEIDPEYQTLTDTFLNLGPYGGILSALRSQRDRAWLVIACDLPLLDKETIQFLIEHRNPGKIATTYESSYDGLPEPLIAIWEPESYAVLLRFLGEGITCPRKVLINSAKTMLQAPNPEALMNANTPDDAEKVREILQEKVLQHDE
jgi:molybdopterin-guanine dinucleotide biosynthesis protein A